MVRNLVTLAAWVAFGLICFVTLSPIGLRPSTGSVGLERLAAFALLGILFALAYPHYFARVALFVVFAAVGLEALQHLTPDRHGQIGDALEKAAGGLAGCSLTRLVQVLKEKQATPRTL